MEASIPRVPYEPYTTAQPQGGGERVSVSTPGAAFGENIGQSLERLGSTTEKVGGELFDRALALQQLRNEADARDAQTEYATRSSLAHADFGALEGKAAADALPGYLKSQSDLRESIRGRLTNPMAQRYYDADTLPFMQRNVFSAAGHAADQNKKAIVGSAQAAVDIAAKTYVNPKDEDEYDAKIATIKASAATIGGSLGWDPVKTQDYVFKETSKQRAAQFTQGGNLDPPWGLEMLEKHKNEMTQEDYGHTQDRLRAANRAVGSVNLANSVYGDGSKSFTQMEAEIKARAPDLAYGDPIFEKDALTALRGKIFYDKTAKRDDDHTTMQAVINDGILRQGGVSNIQELRAIPGMAEKIDSLPPDKQKSLPGMINSYNAARDKQAHEENMTTLIGMAYRDRESFLNLDLTAQNISQPEMRQLMALRARLIKEPINDPRVPQALKELRNTNFEEMKALGVLHEPAKDADESIIKNYDRFLGSLQSALDEYGKAHPGQTPRGEEFQKEIAKPLLRTHVESGMFGLPGFGIPSFGVFGRNVGSFNEAIPKEVIDKARDSMKADAEARGMPQEFSDQEIQREVRRQQWKDLYAKEKSSGGPAPPQPK